MVPKYTVAVAVLVDGMWILAVGAGLLTYSIVKWKRSQLRWTEFVFLCLATFHTRIWHRGRVPKWTPIPKIGPALIICNHTCSADPMFLLASSSRPLSFVASREHHEMSAVTRWILGNLRCVPVTRDGKDPMAVREILRRLDEGRVVCMFPEGNLSGVAKNRLRPPKAGMALVALHKRVPVIPAFIAGGPRTDDLPASWLIPAGRAVRVVFGKPVNLSGFYAQKRDRRTIEQLAIYLMNQMKALDPSAKEAKLR